MAVSSRIVSEERLEILTYAEAAEPQLTGGRLRKWGRLLPGAPVPSECFSASAVLQTIHDERCTSLYGVPTMFLAVLEQPDFERFDCSSLRTCIMAGIPAQSS